VSLPPTPPDLKTVLNTPPDKLPRNRQTEAIHKREVWWQIVFPVLVGLGVLVGLMVVVILAAVTPSGSPVHLWANVSMIFVLAQVIALVLPWLVVFVGLSAGIVYLIRILPPYLKVAQDYTALAALKVEGVMRYVLEPVLKIKSGVAGFDSAIQNLRRFFGYRRS
jgi:hypothetical protein